jgi:hypothetical protein
MGAALSQLELLDHPGRSHRPLRDDRLDRTQTVLLRAALSELQRLESLPAGPLHLSLYQTFSSSLRMLRVYSTTVLLRAATLRVRHFPPKPLKELHRCSPSVCDHFVRDSARVPLPFSTSCCRARMFHECMPNVLTRCFTT